MTDSSNVEPGSRVEPVTDGEGATGRCSEAPGSGVWMVTHGHVFRFKKRVECPYCGAPVVADIHETTQQEDGSWMITSINVDCDSEPDIDGPDWEQWWDEHSHDYCDKWHTLHDRLIRWLAKHVRVHETPNVD